MSTTFYTVAYSVWEALKKAAPLLIGWDNLQEPDEGGVIRVTVDGHRYDISVRRVD